MGSFGLNFANNFAGIAVGVAPIPTKKLTAKLCVRTDITEKLCAITVKDNLGV